MPLLYHRKHTINYRGVDRRSADRVAEDRSADRAGGGRAIVAQYRGGQAE
jgi:hypothetical protein